MPQSFTNPATGEVYVWARTHESEDAAGKQRTITELANTGQTGSVKQQGEDQALTLKLHGTIYHRSQVQAFWKWYELCRTQTIYFTDYDGQQYEVQITAFLPQRVRQQRMVAPDPSMAGTRVSYELDMIVYRAIAGDLVVAGVTP